jgi:EAL domain-containing protein (putative c-di-GMP-specific phosphodiesterase class I)
MEVLSEGVEHEHQARLLAEGSCDTARGHLLAEPLQRPMRRRCGRPALVPQY